MNDLRSYKWGLRSDLIKSAARSFIIRAIGIASTYIFSIFVLSEFDIESWGRITMLFTIIQVVSLLLRAGTDKETMLKFSSKSPNAISYYSKSLSQIALHSAVILMCLAVYFLAAGTVVFHNWNLFYIFIGASALSILMLHSELLRGLKKVGWYSFFEKGGIFTLTAIIGIVSFLTISSTEFNIFNLVLAIVLLCFLAFFVSKKAIQKLPDKITSKELFLESPLKLGLPLMLSGAGFMIMNWTDLFIINANHGDEAVGLFNICSRIASLSAFALLAVNTVNGPKISELFNKKEMKQLEKYVQHSNKISAIVSLIVGIIIFIFPNSFLLAFGIKTPDNTVINCLFILLVGEIINASCGSIGLLLQVTGHRQQFQIIVFISTFISILLGLLFVPKYGIVGGAFANACATAIWNISAFIYAQKKLNIKLFFNKT